MPDQLDRQPVLEGESIRARPLRWEDFDALYAVASDPRIWQQHPARDRHQVEVFRVFFDDAMRSGGALVVESSAGEIIGSSRYHGFDPQAGEVEIGWTFLARSHWGGSTNRELKALMLAHAFRTVEQVIFRVGIENRRSQRAVEKLGATPAGESVDDASGRVSKVFVLSRAAWAELRSTH